MAAVQVACALRNALAELERVDIVLGHAPTLLMQMVQIDMGRKVVPGYKGQGYEIAGVG